MKKMTLALTALMMFGAVASFAGDKKGKKGCCKDKTECSSAKNDKKACCKKDGEKTASAEKPASDKK